MDDKENNGMSSDKENTKTNDSDEQDNDNSEENQANYTNIEDDSEGIVSGRLVEKRGCLKGCLIPIAVIFVIVIALGFVIHAKRGVINEWLMIRIISNTQDIALSDLPKGMDKKPINDTFERTKKAVKEGAIDERAMNQAIKEYIDTVKGKTSEEIKKAETEKLIKALSEAIYPSG